MKVQLPFHNHATGRSAGNIFQTYWGHTFVRSMPILFHYPATKLQLETQYKFFAIDKQFNEVYNDIAKLIPRAQRCNRNTYNTFAKAVFRVAQTYPNQQALDVPKWFGIDAQQQVRLSFSNVICDVASKEISLQFSVQFRLWRRRFAPVTVLLLAVNRTSQSLLAANGPWTDQNFLATIPNVKGWQSTDIVRFYAALSSPSFLSNFYRVVS